MIISLEQVSKYFGADCILQSITAAINEKDRIGLVGANGEGKTTLLNVITGELLYDAGEVNLTNGKILGYLKQNSGLSNGKTIAQEMESIFDDLLSLGDEAKALRIKMQELHKLIESKSYAADEADLELEYANVSAIYSEKQALFEARDGYNINVKISTILNGMGFAEYDRNIVTDNLSGGEKTRLALARLLLKEPDLLILDEPTNHLDFRTLGWLEDYLASYKGAILVVSHDRYFLDKLVNKVWELERKTLGTFKGNYSAYVVQKKERVERQLKEYELQQVQISSMEDYVAKNLVRASTSKSAKSRIAALERMERVEKPITWEKKAAFRFSFEDNPVKDVFHGEGISITVGEGENEKNLCQDSSLDIMRGEKIAIIGTNGVGKSSLLKAILGMIPCKSKRLDWGQKVKPSYYDQENKQLHPDKTAIDEVWDRFPNMYEVDVRTALGRVLLSGEDVYREIKNLSGGERAKVAFACMMLEHGNVLVLDEPTNHLDIMSKEMLEDALEEFEGTILMVSHDRYLLNRIPTKIIDMSQLGSEIYDGKYDYYLEHKQEPLLKKDEKSDEKKDASKKYYRSKQDRAKQVADKKRALLLEELIDKNECTVEDLTSQMSNPEIAADYQRVEEICSEIEKLKAETEAFTEEWLEINE